MGSYFKPWRRKCGVITLVMACAFMGAWSRSVGIWDDIWFTAFGMRTFVISKCGSIGWCGHFIWEPVDPDPHGWQAQSIEVGTSTDVPIRQSLSDCLGVDVDAQFSWNGFAFSRHFEFNNPDRLYCHMGLIPYWSIVLPLTLLSAWLLLSEPRPATQKKTTKSTTEKIV